MKSILGNPARGNDFYPRDKEIKHIYRKIDTGVCLYISAPRRVGKSSILYNLQDKPKNGYQFIYIITESIDEINDFYKEIFENLLESDIIKKWTKVSAIGKEFIGSVLDRVTSIKGIELKESKGCDYFKNLIELLEKIESKDKIVIMIDEFPQTVENINDKYDKLEAQKFLQTNRVLRQNKKIKDNISFIYTGSISLTHTVEKVGELTLINDLYTIPINPLDNIQAKEFLNKLFVHNGLKIEKQAIDYIIDKIQWLIPFHLQLIVSELVDVVESEEKPIDTVLIDTAFNQIVHTRNKPQFEPYFSRLAKIYKSNRYKCVIHILQNIATVDALDFFEIHNLSVKYKTQKELKTILEILEADGYLTREESAFRFTSPILQMWCKKHICK